ncbi:hypothetical protein KJ765_02665 [Candidatus Micrarchaeota archaeon]|nr:hypothetical protein [Candidatus Micrarchaeota archaeon]
MKWRDLLPKDSEVILSSSGTFVLDDSKKSQLGMLVLTQDKLYILLNKGFVKQLLWMYAAIPLSRLSNIQIVSNIVRLLDFNYLVAEQVKHVSFVSLDAEVKHILERIEYVSDNPRESP